MYATLYTTFALLGALMAVQAMPVNHVKRNILQALPESADEMDLRFQPLLDFDTDSCYNTAAIDPNGRPNPGEQATGSITGDCRWRQQLENSNVYSRRRCNNGICAILYEYYFEKDQAAMGSFAGGHLHDWENVVVFVLDGRVLRVAPSCRHKYEDAKNHDFFLLNDTHPLIVYHKYSISTHCFRYAMAKDVHQVENHFGEWYRSPLISWDRWPDNKLRSIMMATWKGKVGPRLGDKFGDTLRDALGGTIPDFDPYIDENVARRRKTKKPKKTKEPEETDAPESTETPEPKTTDAPKSTKTPEAKTTEPTPGPETTTKTVTVSWVERLREITVTEAVPTVAPTVEATWASQATAQAEAGSWAKTVEDIVISEAIPGAQATVTAQAEVVPWVEPVKEVAPAITEATPWVQTTAPAEAVPWVEPVVEVARVTTETIPGVQTAAKLEVIPGAVDTNGQEGNGCRVNVSVECLGAKAKGLMRFLGRS
ncbi:hypothetical protein ACRALDRAFT_1071536 [Sodiomyces alcalophilus JCM 7366]|uniref:uncharacterized protein n=1 Tax=Sodiomyces alcalophilus JCM 7366 TaxID=591952 RepID=UPI0039B499DB